jgi:Phospholipid methyltransferase
LPEERQGPRVAAECDLAFRFTSNGMYVYGFLLLWVPALWWASAAALCVALFNHLYIWVHYFATERPDIDRIYTRDFSG